jgi:RNA polymerase sigma-70 factor (ECF subfamily)
MNRGRLGELLATQVPRLRRYARALTHNQEAADDLVQDSLERAWRKLDRWEAGSDLRAWLFTLMHNVHVNNLRRRRPETVPMTQSDYPAPGQGEADRAMRLRDLEAGLAQLAPDQREVLLLVCLEDMTYEQVAGVLGIPIGTVMSRLHRGRERLRRWMAGEHGEKPPLRRVK